MNYAPRISFSYSRLASWVSRVSMAAEKVIIYEHSADPDNVHIHGLIVGFRKDKTTLKNWCKEALGVKPKKTEWRFPEEDTNGDPVNDNFISYMSKGKYDPKFVKGFTADEIAQYKAKGFESKKTDEKPDKRELYWRGFDKWFAGELDTDAVQSNYTNDQKFELVRRRSYAYMMEHVSLPMPHDIQLHMACVRRMCWEYHIPVPEKSKYNC